MATDKVTYQGSCHCGDVRFEVVDSMYLKVWDCRCSICCKKQNNSHFMVAAGDFKLHTSETKLTTYTFGKHKTKHTFCSTCGVQSFYFPGNSLGHVCVVSHCLDTPRPTSVIKCAVFEYP